MRLICCAALISSLVACSSEPPPNLSGYLSLESLDTSGHVWAQFAREASSPSPMISTVGPCEIRVADSLRIVAGEDAGTITITGTHPDVMLAPDMYGHYAEYFQQTPLYNGGEALTISADGGEVPAFSGHLIAPGKAVVTAPVPSGSNLGGYIVVPATQDLVVTWTGGAAFVDVHMGVGNRSASCQFPASDGTGTIPQAALAAVGGGSFDVSSVDHDEALAGDWHVDIGAQVIATWPNGTPALGNLMLQ